MNTTQVVRADADTTGINLRLWIDDDRGRHVCVSEMHLGEKTMITWARAIAQAQNKACQEQLPYEE